MRYMVLVKANQDSEAGVLPSPEMVAEMGRFNEELVKAGVMLAGEGLMASSEGFRLRFTSEKPVVTDGPFAETKELLAGFWILQVKSREEVLEWMRKAPFPAGEELEIRRIFDPTDWPAEQYGEEIAKEEKLREEIARQGAR